MAHELDGTYQVSSTTSYQGPIKQKSDGITKIANGQTERFDDANCKWTSTFTVLNENEVEMVSVADPTEADEDFLLIGPDGAPTSEPTTFRFTLKLQRKDDKIQMSGQIQHGHDLVFLTMRKVADPEGET